MSTWNFSIWKTSIYLGDNNPNTNKLLSLKMVKIFTRIEVQEIGVSEQRVAEKERKMFSLFVSQVADGG